MAILKINLSRWFTGMPLGAAILLLSSNSTTLAGIEACKQREMPEKLNELVRNIQSSSDTHQIKSLINSYYDLLRKNVSTHEKRTTLGKLSVMLSEYFQKIAKQDSPKTQLSNKRCSITNKFNSRLAELEMNRTSTANHKIAKEEKISLTQHETSTHDYSTVNKQASTNAEKVSNTFTDVSASKESNINSTPNLISNKAKGRLNLIKGEPTFAKSPELVEVERQQVNAIDTEMKFKKKLDQSIILISKSSIERDEIKSKDLQPRTELYTTSDNEEDLLDQLDQLKARQQQIISERIEILKQRMELRGIKTTSPTNAPLPQSQDQFSKMTTTSQEKTADIEESRISSNSIKPQVTRPQSDVIAVNNTNHTDNYLRMSRAYIEEGKASMALSILKDNDKLGSKNAEHHFLSGRAYQDLKLNTDSLESYSVAIYFNPKNYKYWINRGLVKGALGDKRGALDDLTESIKLKETDLAYLNRGVTYAALNKINSALSDLNKAIKMNPSYAKAYRNRGIISHHSGNTNEACKDWERALNNGDKEMTSWIKGYCKK